MLNEAPAQPLTPALRVAPCGHAWVGAVLADIAGLRRSPAGRAVCAALLARGLSVRIERPDPPTSPANAWVQRAECGAVVSYHPADWPGRWPAAIPERDLSSGGVLLHMLNQALDLIEAGG